MSILDFKKKEKHVPQMTGKAFCIHCNHEFVAVSPHGTVTLECPQCHTLKGLFKFPACVPEGELIRQCECGNQLFYLTPEGNLCPNCGFYQVYD